MQVGRGAFLSALLVVALVQQKGEGGQRVLVTDPKSCYGHASLSNGWMALLKRYASQYAAKHGAAPHLRFGIECSSPQGSFPVASAHPLVAVSPDAAATYDEEDGFKPYNGAALAAVNYGSALLNAVAARRDLLALGNSGTEDDGSECVPAATSGGQHAQLPLHVSGWGYVISLAAPASAVAGGESAADQPADDWSRPPASGTGVPLTSWAETAAEWRRLGFFSDSVLRAPKLVRLEGGKAVQLAIMHADVGKKQFWDGVVWPHEPLSMIQGLKRDFSGLVAARVLYDACGGWGFCDEGRAYVNDDGEAVVAVPDVFDRLPTGPPPEGPLEDLCDLPPGKHQWGVATYWPERLERVGPLRLFRCNPGSASIVSDAVSHTYVYATIIIVGSDGVDQGWFPTPLEWLPSDLLLKYLTQRLGKAAVNAAIPRLRKDVDFTFSASDLSLAEAYPLAWSKAYGGLDREAVLAAVENGTLPSYRDPLPGYGLNVHDASSALCSLAERGAAIVPLQPPLQPQQPAHAAGALVANPPVPAVAAGAVGPGPAPGQHQQDIGNLAVVVENLTDDEDEGDAVEVEEGIEEGSAQQRQQWQPAASDSGPDAEEEEATEGTRSVVNRAAGSQFTAAGAGSNYSVYGSNYSVYTTSVVRRRQEPVTDDDQDGGGNDDDDEDEEEIDPFDSISHVGVPLDRASEAKPTASSSGGGSGSSGSSRGSSDSGPSRPGGDSDNEGGGSGAAAAEAAGAGSSSEPPSKRQRLMPGEGAAVAPSSSSSSASSSAASSAADRSRDIKLFRWRAMQECGLVEALLRYKAMVGDLDPSVVQYFPSLSSSAAAGVAADAYYIQVDIRVDGLSVRADVLSSQQVARQRDAGTRLASELGLGEWYKQQRK